jgi:hypothetical protein
MFPVSTSIGKKVKLAPNQHTSHLRVFYGAESMQLELLQRRADFDLLAALLVVLVRAPEERRPGGLTREVEKPLPSNHPRCDQLTPMQLNTIQSYATQCYGLLRDFTLDVLVRPLKDG